MRSNPVRPVITFFPTDDQAIEPKDAMDHISCGWVRIGSFRTSRIKT